MIGSILISVLSFVAVLFVLVLVHEWGHFFAARKFGVKVYEFGFGFPPLIKKMWHRNGTDFTLNWIPLGGFVRLKGEDGSDAHDIDSFAHKKAWQRLVILLAGVAMNFVLGYVIYVGLFVAGVEMPVVGAQQGATIENRRILIGGIMKGSPAELAGIQAGDEVVAINGVPVVHDTEVPAVIKENIGKEVALTVLRGGQETTFDVEPEQLTNGVVGVGMQVVEIGTVKYSFVHALSVAGRETADVSLLIFQTLGQIISKLFTSGELQEGVSGPVGIAAVTGRVAQAGVSPLLQLMAMLSINLGILNVLPIPALDGGRALFVLLEKVIGRKMREGIERTAHVIGFALLMALVLAVTYRDILGLIK